MDERSVSKEMVVQHCWKSETLKSVIEQVGKGKIPSVKR